MTRGKDGTLKPGSGMSTAKSKSRERSKLLSAENDKSKGSATSNPNNLLYGVANLEIKHFYDGWGPLTELAIEENEEDFLAQTYHNVSLEKLQELIHDINTSKCKRHDHTQ